MLEAEQVGYLRLARHLGKARKPSHILGTAVYFLAAARTLLQGKKDGEKVYLLQENQSLQRTQLPLYEILANFNFSKICEMLCEKSPANELSGTLWFLLPLKINLSSFSANDVKLSLANPNQWQHFSVLIWNTRIMLQAPRHGIFHRPLRMTLVSVQKLSYSWLNFRLLPYEGGLPIS